MKKVITIAAAILLYASAASASPIHGVAGKAGESKLIASAISTKRPGVTAASEAMAVLPADISSGTSRMQSFEGISETSSLMVLGAVMICTAGLLLRRKSDPSASL